MFEFITKFIFERKTILKRFKKTKVFLVVNYKHNSNIKFQF